MLNHLSEKMKKFFPNHEVFHFGGDFFAVGKDYRKKTGKQAFVAISPESVSMFRSKVPFEHLLTHTEFADRLNSDKPRAGNEPPEGVQVNIMEYNMGDIVISEIAFETFDHKVLEEIFSSFLKLMSLADHPPGLEPGAAVKVGVSDVGLFLGIIKKITREGLDLEHASLLGPAYSKRVADYSNYLKEEITFKWSEISDIKRIG